VNISLLPSPSLHIQSAVSFIRKIESEGNSVYVHCRAGHGRSAAAVFAWLLYKDPIVDKQLLNAELCRLRNVRRTLWKQANIQQLHERLIIKGGLWTDDDDFIQELPKFLRYDDDPSSSEDDL
jgi:protein-tyrosine phosphatase